MDRNSRRPNRYKNQSGSNICRQPDFTYNAQAAAPDNDLYGYLSRNGSGRNRFAVLAGMDGTDEADEKPELHSWNPQHLDSNTLEPSSTNLQPEAMNFAEQVSSMTFGTGGHAFTASDRSFSTNHASIIDPAYGCARWDDRRDVASLDGLPFDLNGCVNPQALRLNIEDWDKLQEGSQQTPDLPNIPWFYTSDIALCPTPAHMPRELGDVPYAHERRDSDRPWSSEQSRPGVSYGRRVIDQRQLRPLTQDVASVETQENSQIWTSNPGGTERTDTTWDQNQDSTTLGVDATASAGRLLTPDYRNAPTSPTPSEVSITPSIVRETLVCGVNHCRVQFSGIYRRGNLARHIRTVHERREYRCEVHYCNKVFKRQDALKKHFDKKHRIP